MGAIVQWVRGHGLLSVSLVAATVSVALVPPDEAYPTYFDWQTIGCLFCVLAVASAFRLMGAFDYLARAVVGRFSRPVTVSLMLVLVTAAVSMAATNDVALIVILPLSAAILVRAGWVRLVPLVFSLQALAANLCGMITPFGNPQNLYLYSYYRLGLGEFLGVMALPFAVSLVALVSVTILGVRRIGKGRRAGRGSVVNCAPAPGPVDAAEAASRRFLAFGRIGSRTAALCPHGAAPSV